jgi:hypothetical protein
MQKVEPQKITEIMWDKNSEVITETPKQKLITKIKETISDPRSGLDNYTKDYITQYVDEYQWDFTKVLKLSNDKILLALRDNTISSQDQNMKDPLYSFLENWELTKKESKNYDVIGDIQKSNNRAEKLIVEKQLAEEARLFAKNQAKQKNKNRGYASLWDVIWGANPYSKN